MKPLVSIIMGSTSDLPVLKKAADFLNDLEIPFEMNALSAHRTPKEVEEYATGARDRGIQVIIAAAGMSAALPGVIAALTSLPVIGLPINSSLEGVDALLSITQMPPGIPVVSVGINGGLNAAVIAARILSLQNDDILKKLNEYSNNLKNKIIQANIELKQVEYRYKTN